ncbi:PD-(D/E)XK nuclease family transposase [Fibrobacter sp. UWB5]|uniref:PD-(D/E)XK nuclease family transposase n=1 Tax=Fibrobacter sp. UWB5 TaxID=1964360 RepID=UPI000B52654F|nr:PD-(D/E)XK nuclease family transposase [Fibrobacter sp. UWB5]OWV12204.1 hypothetical protein B7989_07685 [Fibrobacter sp. UWB5]
MTKEQYAEMLKDISETHKQGGNISACIESISFVNPAIVAPFSKNITSDIVAEDQHLDRIVLEVQHVCGDSYRDRLVLYTAKHTVASRVKGEDYKLRNLNLISLQMFNGFPESSNYRHTIRLKNQDNEVYFDKQTITLVEIPKLCIFTEEFLVSEAMKMSDHNYELYVEKKQAREEGLAEGRAEGRAEERADNLAVLQDMNLSPEQIAEFKARLEARGK